MRIFLLHATCVLFVLSLIDGAETDTIRAVAIITTDGERSPLESYPNDPHKKYIWSGGYGALSPNGIEQLYKSGQIKGTRYISLLTQNHGLYSQEFMYARSILNRRYLTSGQSFLAGFLPPPIDRNILPVAWQPVPIHAVPARYDDTLAMTRICPKYDPDLLKSLSLSDPQVQHVIKYNNSIIDYIHASSGSPILNLHSIAHLTGILQDQKIHGLEMPKWAQDLYNTTLTPLKDIFRAKVATSKSMTIKGGRLLNEIVERFKGFVNGSSTRNVLFYVGHDVTLLSLGAALGVLDQMPAKPQAAASIAIELHVNRSLNNQHMVKIVYFSESLDEYPLLLHMKACKHKCPFNMFRELLRQNRTYSFRHACDPFSL